MAQQIMVNGNSMDWEQDLTITGILKKKRFTFKLLVVKVDGKLVKKDKYDTTTIPPGASVQVLHLMSGG